MSAPHYPEGGYIGKVTSQALVKAGTGTPQFVIRFTVERTSRGEDPNGKFERTIYRAITEKTKDYVKEDLEALGFTGKSFSDLSPNSPNHFDLTGKEISVYCKHESDTESNMREKWSISKFKSKEIEGEPVTDFASLDAMFDFSSAAAPPKPKAATKSNASATTVGGSNGSTTVVGLSDDELAAKVVELVRSKGNTLAKKSLGVNLLTLKLQRDDIKKAQSEEFLKAYDGAVWKYDGSSIVVE